MCVRVIDVTTFYVFLNGGIVQTVVFFVFHFIYLFVIYFLFQNVLKLPTKSSGGPIIAFQVENEFGSYSNEAEHLKFIKEV